MAVSSERDSKEAADSSSLNLLSANFDPLKALSSSNESINLPCPEVQPLDNLAQYEAIVKGRASERALAARREQRSGEGTACSEEPRAVSDTVYGPADADESSGHKSTKQVRTVVKFMKGETKSKILQMYTCACMHFFDLIANTCCGITSLCVFLQSHI